MSLNLKCFATVIETGSHPLSFESDGSEADGHIEIHSTPYELLPADFIRAVFYLGKDVVSYTGTVTIGEDNGRELLIASEPIFTKFASKEKEKYPIPLFNQPISLSKNENSKFTSSRFWVYKNYFFVTNRHYSESELHEVKMKIHYIVKKFNDELNVISEELKSIGVSYKD
jgi:hypothetical protein